MKIWIAANLALLACSQHVFLEWNAIGSSISASLFEFDSQHNGGVVEEHVSKVVPFRPHIVFILVDDLGWANVGWHSDAPEVRTPLMDALVKSGIEFDRHYMYQFCSPSRSAIQSGRNPLQVNPLNIPPSVANPDDPIGGFAGIARNITGIASKMAAAGYRTHFSGKWDVGMATPDHTPRGRGYHTSLNYFHHDNSYWDNHYSDASEGCASVDPLPTGHPVDPPGSVGIIVDLWRAGADGTEGPAQGWNNTCGSSFPFNMGDRQKYDQGTQEDYGPWPVDYVNFVIGKGCRPGPEALAAGDIVKDHEGYEDALFEQDVLATIYAHPDTSAIERPLFLFWAPHIAHAPLQVPAAFLEQLADVGPTDNRNHARQIYAAMVHWLDCAIGNVTAALKQRQMWDRTLLILASDNGGPVYQNGTSGANNFPLRGGKMSNWEGGIRVSAFAAGGFIPSAMRGQVYNGLTAGWDWYATFCDLAGISAFDARAAAAGLPPVDSYSLAKILTGANLTSPRQELALGTPTSLGGRLGGLLRPPWKLLVGDVPMAGWQGPTYPNTTTDTNCFDSPSANPSKLPTPCAPACWCIAHCGETGCLFNIEDDPTEHNDLAATKSDVAKELLDRLGELNNSAVPPSQGGLYNPVRGAVQQDACKMAMGPYGGFWGPWLK